MSPAERYSYKYCSRLRVSYVQRQPCCVCGRLPTFASPSHNHHVIADGTGKKAKYIWVTPLCERCHRRYHSAGKLSLLQWVMSTHGGLLIGGRRIYEQWEDAAAATEAMWRRYETALEN